MFKEDKTSIKRKKSASKQKTGLKKSKDLDDFYFFQQHLSTSLKHCQEMNYEKYQYKLILSYFQKIGPIGYKKLLNFFQNEENIFKANLYDLIQAGIKEKIANEFLKFKNNFNLNKVYKTLQKEKIFLKGIDDPDYPPLLKEIYDPPFLLYYKGEFFNNFLHIAVVGSRNYTHYGERICLEIIPELAKNNIVIVSGMAIGIDSIAHQSALKRGKTIAVLGSGIDAKNIYPKRNKNLFFEISEKGLVLSEFPPGTIPAPFNFPRRNRIVSGLSHGVFVVEAEKKSGSLITARLAIDQNRDIFAPMGNIFSPTQKGTNDLIKQGAKAIDCADDFLENFNIQKTSKTARKEKIKLDKNEKIIFTHLSYEAKHIDEIIRSCPLPAQTTNATLSIMELKGLVKNIGAMKYVINISSELIES